MWGRDLPIKLEPSWLVPLAAEFEQPYMEQLGAFLLSQKRAGKRILPRSDEIFNAFRHTPLSRVKVVILGQDPYHGDGQAHGLCFSVRPGVPVPPSLKNIYKELHAELGLPIPVHGYLTWLLYPSDAADQLHCVDLGGRRDIKKNKPIQTNEQIHE